MVYSIGIVLLILSTRLLLIYTYINILFRAKSNETTNINSVAIILSGCTKEVVLSDRVEITKQMIENVKGRR